MKVCEIGKEVAVGHLPKEISRVTKLFIGRVATVSVKLTGVHYRRSPLVQGGMEIPCRIKMQIPGTVSNLLAMERYKQLVAELYIDPKEEQILGSVLEPDSENQVAIEKDGQNNPPGEKEPKQQRKQTGSGMKDIRSFFSLVQREKGSASDIVTID